VGWRESGRRVGDRNVVRFLRGRFLWGTMAFLCELDRYGVVSLGDGEFLSWLPVYWGSGVTY